MKKNLFFGALFFSFFQLTPFGGGLSVLVSVQCILLCLSNQVEAQNIGISTDASAPETGLMLDIKTPTGYAKNANNSAQPFFQIKSFDSDATALKLRLGLRTDATQSNRYGFMEFLEAGTPTYLPLALQPSGGNVGIGTTAPASALHVYGGAAASQISLSRANSFAAQAVWRYNSANNEFGTLGNDNVSFLTNNTSRIFIEAASGKVGIGITSPTERLHVYGTGQSPSLTSSTGIFHIGNNISQALSIGADPNAPYSIWLQTKRTSNDGTSWPISFNPLGGNVGIGTTTPSNDLEISDPSGGNTGLVISNPSTANKLMLSTNTGGTTYVTSSGGNLGLVSTTGYVLVDPGNNVFAPNTDNTISCGSAGKRWTVVWAVDGTINTSDFRKKKNIKKLEYGLKEVMKLNPVSFNWKSGNSNTKLGFIAQEIQTIIPEVVTTGADEDKTFGIYYTDIIPILTKAIQDQQTIIEGLKTQNTAILNEMKNLSNQNSQLKVKMEMLEQISGSKRAEVKR